MITRSPRASAVDAYSNIQSGVRCALTTRASKGMPSSASTSAAGARVDQSDELPMMMPTRAGDASAIR